jgi:hypothetical protein
MDWMDRAYEEIENELAEGNITQKEYHQQLRELRAEIRDSQCGYDDERFQ